jgi:hypothetical protein
MPTTKKPVALASVKYAKPAAALPKTPTIPENDAFSAKKARTKRNF